MGIGFETTADCGGLAGASPRAGRLQYLLFVAKVTLRYAALFDAGEVRLFEAILGPGWTAITGGGLAVFEHEYGISCAVWRGLRL